MRASLLSVSSFALVATAVAAVLAPSQAQDVPVVYRTDPGAAHPRYAEPVAEVNPSPAAASTATIDPTQTSPNTGCPRWMTPSMTWNARRNSPSGSRRMPGMTTTAKVSTIPATRVHASVAAMSVM